MAMGGGGGRVENPPVGLLGQEGARGSRYILQALRLPKPKWATVYPRDLTLSP